MIHPPEKAKIESLKAERDGAWTCFRGMCTRTGNAQRKTYDAGKAAANIETLKQTAADHPWMTTAAAAAGTALAVKLVSRLPIKSIGLTAVSIAARYYVPRIINNFVEKQCAVKNRDHEK
jgi:hypothetical protein